MDTQRSKLAWQRFIQAVLTPVCLDQPCSEKIWAKGRCQKHYFAWRWRNKQAIKKEERADAEV